MRITVTIFRGALKIHRQACLRTLLLFLLLFGLDWVIQATWLRDQIAPAVPVRHPAPKKASASARAGKGVPVKIKKALASAPALKVVNLFFVPPPPPPPPPIVPVPPPLPFQLQSLWQWDNQTVAALRLNGALYLVCDHCSLSDAWHPGAQIAGLYRLESITSTRMTFIYLPLKASQQLALDGLNS